jgi:hypothetical protein
MVKAEIIRLDPQGTKRVMDVGGPSALPAAVKISKKAMKHKYDKDKLINKPTKLTKHPRHTLRSPQSVDPDSSSPENSDAELGSIWADSKTPSTDKDKNQFHTHPSQPPQWHALLAARTLR